MPAMKIVIVLALLGILGALASAGAFMLRRGRQTGPDAPTDRQMARALALRVAISVALFLFVLFAWFMGWVRPTGLPTG